MKFMIDARMFYKLNAGYWKEREEIRSYTFNNINAKSVVAYYI